MARERVSSGKPTEPEKKLCLSRCQSKPHAARKKAEVKATKITRLIANSLFSAPAVAITGEAGLRGAGVMPCSGDPTPRRLCDVKDRRAAQNNAVRGRRKKERDRERRL